MITHYDMATGEMIADETAPTTPASVEYDEPRVALRLMRVDEDLTASNTKARALPVDVAHTDVASFIAKWS